MLSTAAQVPGPTSAALAGFFPSFGSENGFGYQTASHFGLWNGFVFQKAKEVPKITKRQVRTMALRKTTVLLCLTWPLEGEK